MCLYLHLSVVRCDFMAWNPFVTKSTGYTLPYQLKINCKIELSFNSNELFHAQLKFSHQPPMSYLLISAIWLETFPKAAKTRW